MCESYSLRNKLLSTRKSFACLTMPGYMSKTGTVQRSEIAVSAPENACQLPQSYPEHIKFCLLLSSLALLARKCSGGM